MGRDSANDQGHSHSEIITAALEIAEERNGILRRIRELLKSGQDQQAIPLMKRYCGMSENEKGIGAAARLN